jgi:hypothetical protein
METKRKALCADSDHFVVRIGLREILPLVGTISCVD